MPPEINPESIRDASFRTTLRGLDRDEVVRFLDEVATEIENLREKNDRLASRLGEFADRDLKSEFENVGREVTTVLEAAREAAETMRERATLDAARWRSEAMAEAEQMRKDAKNDAEALRGDAWAAGSDLLDQVVAETNRLAKQSERDAITITGEAERDAHRLVSNARREAEDMVRTATMEAEKLTAQAAKAHDEMIEQARRQAEASQERTRALEQRREELMEELDGVRSTLSQLEGTLEAKREDLNLSRTSDSSVKIIPTAGRPEPRPHDEPRTWEPGETVRVIRGEEDPPAQEQRPPVSRQASSPTPTIEPAEPAPVSEPVAEPPDEHSAPPPAESPAPATQVDDVEALFASLRDTGEMPRVQKPAPEPSASAATEDAQSDQSAEGQPAEVSEPQPSAPQTISGGPGDELIEQRDGALLPITNRALRGVKKAMTDAQNIALDGLRTDSEWKPDQAQLAETLRADLITLWAESYTAGHDMAQQMLGEKLKRPATPTTASAEEFGSALVSDLEAELAGSGDGQRERQSAASKVFRGWRTDEAERRIRHLSLEGFHRGFAESAKDQALVWVASGTPCSACRQAAESPRTNLPPIHPGCECTLAV